MENVNSHANQNIGNANLKKKTFPKFLNTLTTLSKFVVSGPPMFRLGIVRSVLKLESWTARSLHLENTHTQLHRNPKVAHAKYEEHI